MKALKAGLWREERIRFLILSAFFSLSPPFGACATNIYSTNTADGYWSRHCKVFKLF